jgi:hypothetical protein
MSYDLSWLWNALFGVASPIISWFTSLWDATSQIVNTGQGIFTGLVAFGTQLWDAITKAFNTIGGWFYNAFNWIWQGLNALGNWFWQGLTWLGGALGSAFSWIAQQLYNFGMWLYNGLTFVWNWIVNALIGVWNAITSFFGGIASAIGSWWGNVVSGINSWFTSLVVGIRNKLMQTIIADVSIYFGWKSMERLTSASTLKDAGFSLLGLIGSPFVAYLFGNIINGMIPTPSTTPMQLIPEIPMFTYSPPSLTIQTPTEKPSPTLGYPPTYGVGYGLPYDVTLKIPHAPSYDFTTATNDRSLTMPSITYEYEVS